MRKGWGSVARKGARTVKDGPPGTASGIWRSAVEADREATRARPDAFEPEVWLEDAPEPATPSRARTHTDRPDAATRTRRAAPPVPAEVAAEVGSAVPASRRSRVESRLAEAIKAYERDRYPDALKILKPLSELAPQSAAVRELLGLTLYRMGRWAAAIKELEAVRALTAELDQVPVLADCYRARKQWPVVEALWEELRKGSPGAELLAEGRIVTAGARADQGDLAGAIALIEQGKPNVKHPRLHHLRLQYALADLYERAGELPRARELFLTLLRHDEDLFDIPERLNNLR